MEKYLCKITAIPLKFLLFDTNYLFKYITIEQPNNNALCIKILALIIKIDVCNYWQLNNY